MCNDPYVVSRGGSAQLASLSRDYVKLYVISYVLKKAVGEEGMRVDVLLPASTAPQIKMKSTFQASHIFTEINVTTRRILQTINFLSACLPF